MRDDKFQERGEERVRRYAGRRGFLYVWLLSSLASLFLIQALAEAVDTIPPGSLSAPAVRLNLSEAVDLFLKNNLDLLISKYGIEYSKGQQITARLFPNPVLQVGTQSAWTQGNTLTRSGEVQTQIQQLFELAGKRGYRIESAGFGTQSAEANFEDAVRLLG